MATTVHGVAARRMAVHPTVHRNEEKAKETAANCQRLKTPQTTTQTTTQKVEKQKIQLINPVG